MKRLALIIGAHVVVAALLVLGGLRLNNLISNEYAGLVTVLSLALTVYTTALNVLYQRSYRFHLFVNRLRLRFSRTHTFWQPLFRFDGVTQKGTGHQRLDDLWRLLSEGAHGTAAKKTETPTTLSISIDELFVIAFRAYDESVSMSFEQKLLVPAHLYDQYGRRLARLAEDVAQCLRPTATRYGLRVSFGDGMRNPYYGFFVSRIPASLLEGFQATFRLDPASKCQIEAGTDHVNIEAASLADTFDALRQVLSLRATPTGI